MLSKYWSRTFVAASSEVAELPLNSYPKKAFNVAVFAVEFIPPFVVSTSKFCGDPRIILLPSILFFLYFNKPIAKMYMGDSGSVLIGFINGFIFAWNSS